MLEIPTPNFDLEKTLNSGQVFHWNKCGAGFAGTIGEHAVYVEQRSQMLYAQVGATAPRCAPRTMREFRKMVRHYFALDHPLEKIGASFPADATMRAALDFCRGLRIIRQPRWECLATFICSSMKQVAHIRQISLALRQRFGKEQIVKGNELFSFPTARRLGRASEAELKECGLGYRAKNLRATARYFSHAESRLEAWNALPDEELYEKLCELPGIGAKVANCVMLFAFERITAFPIDIWIDRVLREKYFFRKKNVPARELTEFVRRYFGPYGGYAQQYLFHHARMTKVRRSA